MASAWGRWGVCFRPSGGINKRGCFPNISDFILTAFWVCPADAGGDGDFTVKKTTLSQEGEEDFLLVLSSSSVLPLTLTLGWKAVKLKVIWWGKLLPKTSWSWGWVQSQTGSRACCTVAVWASALSFTWCLKSVSSKVSLKLHLYFCSFVALVRRQVCEGLLQEPVLLKSSLCLLTGWAWWALSRWKMTHSFLWEMCFCCVTWRLHLFLSSEMANKNFSRFTRSTTFINIWSEIQLQRKPSEHKVVP